MYICVYVEYLCAHSMWPVRWPITTLVNFPYSDPTWALGTVSEWVSSFSASRGHSPVLATLALALFVKVWHLQALSLRDFCVRQQFQGQRPCPCMVAVTFQQGWRAIKDIEWLRVFQILGNVKSDIKQDDKKEGPLRTGAFQSHYFWNVTCIHSPWKLAPVGTLSHFYLWPLASS